MEELAARINALYLQKIGVATSLHRFQPPPKKRYLADAMRQLLASELQGQNPTRPPGSLKGRVLNPKSQQRQRKPRRSTGGDSLT